MAGRVEVDAPVAVGDAGLLRGLRRSQCQHGLLGRVDIIDRHVDVELLHAGQSILLAKTGKEWRIEKPVQARADDGQVKQVLDTLLTTKADQLSAASHS